MLNFYNIYLVPSVCVNVEDIKSMMADAHDWYRYGEYSWIIYTSLNSERWFEKLKVFIQPNDGCIFISKLDIHDCKGYMDGRLWEWIDCKLLDAVSYLALNKEIVKEKIKKQIGCYRLGNLDIHSKFCCKYVGRDDVDVQQRLLNHIDLINAKKEPHYTHFKVYYYNNSHIAYLQECKDYHRFEHLDNKIHPAKPDGTDWKCPNKRCEYSGDSV